MIKVGFNVSYDWFLLKKSLPRVYDYADVICLSIDKDHRTWSGTAYEFDDRLFVDWIKEVDVKNKIDVYRDDFYVPTLSAMDNDSRQRRLMSERMGVGGWHIQVDSDEYFMNFQSFVKTLKGLDPNPTGRGKPVNICPVYIPLIKKTKSGYLYVDFQSKLPEYSPLASNVPAFEAARRNGHFNMVVPHYVVHETWARSDDELAYKMQNWGHADDEFAQVSIRQSYYKLWQSLDEHNYQYLHNFHPGNPPTWPRLGFFEATSVEDLMQRFKEPAFPLNPFELFLQNSRNVARVRSVLDRLF